MITKNSPDIQKFLDSAMEESKIAGMVCDIPSFEEFWTEKYSADDVNFARGAFLGDVSMLQNHNQISYYKELSSFRRGISALVLPIKKVIRKLVAFLFLPVIAEQNEINLSVARLFEHMRSYINKDSAAGSIRAQREIEAEAQLRKQSETICELTQQVELLTKRIEALEKGGSEK